MTLKQMRRLIVAHLEDNWAKPVKIYYENTEKIDLAHLDSFIRCEIKFNAAERANIDPQPFHRTYGRIILEVFVKESTGTETMLEHLEELTQLLKFKNLDGVQLDMPEPGNDVQSKGWYSQELTTSFQADSNA